MENLAPAGNRAALERADAAGADAVYLGYAAFSARAGAGNFDRQELEDAIRFAHLRHMRVHVTVNTLVKDGELGRVTEVLRLLTDLDPGPGRAADCPAAFPGTDGARKHPDGHTQPDRGNLVRQAGNQQGCAGTGMLPGGNPEVRGYGR